MKRSDQIIIGLTGGIASGKSTVSAILHEAGAHIIDADKIAREVVSKGEKALDELVQEFGTAILDSQGELDRKKLGSVVFGSDYEVELRRKKLNQITHKYILEKSTMILEELYKDKAPKIIVLDYAIPVQKGFLDTADTIWVIIANRQNRISRIIKRNSCSYEEAVKRIDSQLAEDEYLAIADFIIHNNCSIDELKEQVFNKLQNLIGDRLDSNFI